MSYTITHNIDECMEAEKASSKANDLLVKCKEAEKKLLASGKINKVKIINGYAFTAHPEDFDYYKK